MITIKNKKINPHSIIMTDDEYLDIYNKNKIFIDQLLKKTTLFLTDYNEITIINKVIHFKNFFCYILKIRQIPEMILFFAILKYKNTIDYSLINPEYSDRLNKMIYEIRMVDFSKELKLLNKRIDIVEQNINYINYLKK